jgi:hypothetical protein
MGRVSPRDMCMAIDEMDRTKLVLLSWREMIRTGQQAVHAEEICIIRSQRTHAGY